MKLVVNGVEAEIPNETGGSTPVKALTKAEYSTLPEAEKQADVLYVVTDDEPETGSGSNGAIYSAEETRIGMWFGKPLYRKVISIVLSNETITHIPISADIIVRRGEIYVGTATGQEDVIPGIFQLIAIEASNWVSWYFDRTNHRFTIWSGKYKNASAYIIAEYTKTTD